MGSTTVLVYFDFLAERNNTAPVRIATEDGSIVSIHQFMNNAFDRAAQLAKVTFAGKRSWDARSTEALKAKLREKTTFTVRWTLGDRESGNAMLSPDDDDTWAYVSKMLSEARGSHHVVVNKFPKVDWDFFYRDDVFNCDSTNWARHA
ncbi:hypothetical protein CMUS01_07031 [Colletotrichum musicola]|uniref:Uncharacterized protein n=1 Tax=Colletotrichum musicola TaxID=2175873 RepID=A0A8H6KJD7_9PEZI|nr:hypothetical protein CMUS01_07031 [Colletotrichum musicola]